MTMPNPLPEIHLSSMAYTVDHWLPREASGNMTARDPFDLNAPYQRGSVWTDDQRRALIQSLYMGLPVGAVVVSKLPYLAEREHDYRIVDGKQRIETVRAFVADRFAVPRWWFRAEDQPDLPPLIAQVYFSELPVPTQRHFTIRASLPGLEFDPQREFVGWAEPEGTDKLTGEAHRRPVWRQRDEEQMIRAEARVYVLINGGGTPQDDSDFARAEAITRGEGRPMTR